MHLTNSSASLGPDQRAAERLIGPMIIHLNLNIGTMGLREALRFHLVARLQSLPWWRSWLISCLLRGIDDAP